MFARKIVSLRRGISFSTVTTKERNENIYNGIFPILVTPFLDNRAESIDFTSFRRCISFMKHAGVSGITIAGVLGESNRLTDFERQALLEAAVEELRADSTTPSERRLNLCVGTTHTGTAGSVALSQMASDCGADGVMISPTIPLSGPQPSDDDIVELYQRVSDACPKLSIIVQDLPSLTGVYMSTDLLIKIVSTVDNVRSIKLESPPTASRIASLRANETFQASDCTILCGLGALYAGFDLKQGISGFMTGFAFPEILVAMMDLANEGKLEQAHALYLKYLDLIVLEQQPGGLSLRKEIYRRRSLITSASLRHPGGNITPVLQEVIDEQLKRSFPLGIDFSKPIQIPR